MSLIQKLCLFVSFKNRFTLIIQKQTKKSIEYDNLLI